MGFFLHSLLTPCFKLHLKVCHEHATVQTQRKLSCFFLPQRDNHAHMPVHLKCLSWAFGRKRAHAQRANLMQTPPHRFSSPSGSAVPSQRSSLAPHESGVAPAVACRRHFTMSACNVDRWQPPRYHHQVLSVKLKNCCVAHKIVTTDCISVFVSSKRVNPLKENMWKGSSLYRTLPETISLDILYRVITSSPWHSEETEECSSTDVLMNADYFLKASQQCEH